MEYFPGPILLFGSGETSPTGRKIFDYALKQLKPSPHIALLETPAGFELNSARVIGRVAEFMQVSLQNYRPRTTTIPARKRGTPHSPDEFDVVKPMLEADLIFMGPGSPTYAVRQLRDSLAWSILLARHRLGATLALASAATIAISACTLPVYEIYKVGEDLHWKEGLNFFGLYGLELTFIPHWNNTEGGADLDTSYCFMGKTRFSKLIDMLPCDSTVIGLDEKTALIIDPCEGKCHVFGLGNVTLIHTGHIHRQQSTSEIDSTGLNESTFLRENHVHQYHNKESFSLTEIGPFRPYRLEAHLPVDVWQHALQVAERQLSSENPEPPQEVLQLVELREKARANKDWAESDAIRQKITTLGWQVQDTKDGPALKLDQD